MNNSGEVTVECRGKQYGAMFKVTNSMMLLKPPTATRSVEVGDADAKTLAPKTINEIDGSQCPLDVQGDEASVFRPRRTILENCHAQSALHESNC